MPNLYWRFIQQAVKNMTDNTPPLFDGIDFVIDKVSGIFDRRHLSKEMASVSRVLSEALQDSFGVTEIKEKMKGGLKTYIIPANPEVAVMLVNELERPSDTDILSFDRQAQSPVRVEAKGAKLELTIKWDMSTAHRVREGLEWGKLKTLANQAREDCAKYQDHEFNQVRDRAAALCASLDTKNAPKTNIRGGLYSTTTIIMPDFVEGEERVVLKAFDNHFPGTARLDTSTNSLSIKVDELIEFRHREGEPAFAQALASIKAEVAAVLGHDKGEKAGTAHRDRSASSSLSKTQGHGPI